VIVVMWGVTMPIPTVKGPIPRSVELLDRVKTALTPNRLPLLIAIDGMDGVGKSSLGSWLAWQLGMPAVHLDLFIASLYPIQWLTADLKRLIEYIFERESVEELWGPAYRPEGLLFEFRGLWGILRGAIDNPVRGYGRAKSQNPCGQIVYVRSLAAICATCRP
jgi:hypothetical protein